MNFSAVTKSIRGRLLLWLAFLMTCILTGFGVTAYQLHYTNQFDQLDDELKHRVAVLSVALRAPPIFTGSNAWPLLNSANFNSNSVPPPPPVPPIRPVVLSAEAASLFDEKITNGFYFILWSYGGSNVLKHSRNAPADTPRPAQPGRDTATYTWTRGTFREACQYTELGECVLVGRSIDYELEAANRFAEQLAAIGMTVLILGLCGGWILASRALRPVEEISAAASRISAGNLSERINVADTDNELGRLAQMLNATFARLEAAFAQQQRFTADAAHELRTPIAVLISEAQTTLARKRNAEDYEETIAAFLETSQQMRRLTESLLELARFDAGQEQLGFNPINVAEVVRNCVELVRPLAAGRNLQIHCDLAPAETRGNADLLGQVITNLLTNAIHHNKLGGEIRVSTRAENKSVIITVTDNGEGIAAEDLPHIFERFYRADKSRSRASGRSGLGLAICHAIVAAHGGSIEVSSQPGAGATFTVRLAS